MLSLLLLLVIPFKGKHNYTKQTSEFTEEKKRKKRKKEKIMQIT